METFLMHVSSSLVIFALSCFTCMFSSLVAASDMITIGEQIRDGKTLVSAQGIFELGFFSPPNTTNRYVGIWYKKVPIQTIVWVANRETPVIDTTGILTINNDGNLVIIDWRGSSIMLAYGSPISSNISSQAQLLDSGNFVWRENSGRVLWQSFDYPTDSFLPGMKLGRNLKTKQNRLFTSWKNAQDPAPGIYSFGADPNGTTQFFIWQRRTVYWSSGEFNGSSFSLVPSQRLVSLFNYSFISNDDEQYFTYSFFNKSINSRFVIQPSGQGQQLTWSENLGNFEIFWSYPRDLCDVIAPCGAYGICNTNSSSLCKCLQGFQPVSPRDWNSRSTSDGCQRQSKLKCGDRDAFLKFKTIKLPDDPEYFEDIGYDPGTCETMCFKNCSCLAYASRNKTGCLFWRGNLMGLRENFDDTGQVYGDYNLFIRVTSDPDEGNSTPLDQGKKRRIWVIVGVPVAAASLLFVFSTLYFCWILHNRKVNEERRKNLLGLEIGTNEAGLRKLSFNKFNKDEKGSSLQLFTFASITAATGNFSVVNKLGQGGFGPVYKGKLLEGQEIAVKRLSRSSGQGLEEFKNEIGLIAKLQHTNLVRLLGCCIQVEEKILIYEYMPNKSLDSFLFDPMRKTELDWGRRVRIIEGIAQGLLYLHKYSRVKVIHRDLKASNILLDGEMNPKISDFGMARVFGNNESEVNTNRIVGTYGYMSPEYAMKGIFSEKSDVFSFGVLLLEIISGQKNTSFDHGDHSLNFLGYVWELWNYGNTAELVDSLFGDSASVRNEFVRFVNIVLLCVQENAVDRPTMLEVVSLLGNKSMALPIPKKPAFFITRNTAEVDSTTGSHQTCSANGLTVSIVDAR